MFEPKVSKEQFDLVSKDLSIATSLNMQLEAKLEEAKNTIETLSTKHVKTGELVKQHKLVLEQLKTQHELELNSVKNSLNKQINQSLASIGVNQFAAEIYSGESQKSDKELLTQFNSLPKEKQSEFYQQHKAALSRAVLSKT
jgi:hypothetical protein